MLFPWLIVWPWTLIMGAELCLTLLFTVDSNTLRKESPQPLGLLELPGAPFTDTDLLDAGE